MVERKKTGRAKARKAVSQALISIGLVCLIANSVSMGQALTLRDVVYRASPADGHTTARGGIIYFSRNLPSTSPYTTEVRSRNPSTLGRSNNNDNDASLAGSTLEIQLLNIRNREGQVAGRAFPLPRRYSRIKAADAQH